MAYYAAIGTDGTRPVVWGLGMTPAKARDEAVTDWPRVGPLATVEITAEQDARVRAGEVSCAQLGIVLSKSELAEIS